MSSPEHEDRADDNKLDELEDTAGEADATGQSRRSRPSPCTSAVPGSAFSS